MAILTRIGIILLWVLLANFCAFVRVFFYDMDEIIDGEKYFTAGTLMLHGFATILGIYVGIEPLLF